MSYNLQTDFATLIVKLKVAKSTEIHFTSVWNQIARQIDGDPARPVVLNLFKTVAHFVFFESLHSPLLWGPPLLGHTSVALHLKKSDLHFRVSVICQVIALSLKKQRSSSLEWRFLP